MFLFGYTHVSNGFVSHRQMGNVELAMPTQQQSKKGIAFAFFFLFFFFFMAKVYSESEIQSHFLDISRETLIECIKSLQLALKRFSKYPYVVPERMITSTPSGDALHLFMPVIDDYYTGIKALGYGGGNRGFNGVVNVLDPKSGVLKGVFEAKELTAIRTSIVSLIPLYVSRKFENLADITITVFGTGLQSFWHIINTLKYFEHLPITVNVFYRNNMLKEEFCTLIDTFEQCRLCQYQWDDEQSLSRCLSQSNIVYGCVPTKSPKLQYEHLRESEIKDIYVSLIGSYTPEMHECDTSFIEKFKTDSVSVIVDSISDTLREAGELVTAHTTKDELVEIGQLESQVPSIKNDRNNSIILVKIVGLAIMDVAMAQVLLESN